ncbi:DUF6491 family protein [Chitiniphilus purpureus]|uniref:DUF6491 family protein n=1 Tax=Chitiniphilus purpureus TaxID=2981137 RepID=A0ABY6DNN2_9NEIS|nr:DUF6491 family protein [Chitiniphilus sp. CD1]UXY15961.1 DUF6491 family protein [Chitiniphilus sp. CD1]
MPNAAALLITLTLSVLAPAASARPQERQQLRLPSALRWRPAAPDQVLLWTGREEVWRLHLQAGCRVLPSRGGLGFTVRHGHFKAGRDRIRAVAGACRVERITAAPPSPRQGSAGMPTFVAWRIEVSAHAKNNNAYPSVTLY